MSEETITPEDTTSGLTGENQVTAEEIPAENEIPQLNALQEEEALRAAMQAAVHEILSDDSHFDNLEKHESLELVFLMENLSAQEDIKTNIPRVAQLKKAFDFVHTQSLQALESLEDEELKEKTEKQLKVNFSRFNTAFSKFNKKKEEFEKTLEQEKEQNSKAKESLLEELRLLVEANDPTLIDKIKNIQERWKSIGMVKSEDMGRLFQAYRLFLDNFYDLRGKYRDLLEQDRKYNLIEKQKLIEEARKLVPAEEMNDREFWKEKTDELKRLHELWKSFGPVPDEVSEELWNQFRQVSDDFYAARNKYYEQQDHLRSGNADQKQAILNQLSPLATFTSVKPAEWKDATELVLKLQKEWNAIGPATQETNTLLWARYRTAINSFFERKSNFFKSLDQERKDNLAVKTALCEEVEKLKDSNEWKKATDKIKDLQEKWKKAGPVSERDSQRIWKRFRSACDAFFQRKEHHFAALVHDFEENLAKKIALCEKAEAFAALENKVEQIQAVKDLQLEWNTIGQIPLKEKDKVWGRFRSACDQFFNALGQTKSEMVQMRTRMQYENMATKSDQGKSDPLRYEEKKLRDKIRELDGQIDQYETNILFISKGKAGDALRTDIQKKIESVKKDKAAVVEKLKVLQSVKTGS